MNNKEYKKKFERMVEYKGEERALNLFAELKPDLLGPEAGVVVFPIPTWFGFYVRQTPTRHIFNDNAWKCIWDNINALDDNSEGWCEALKILKDEWFLGADRKMRHRVFKNALEQARTIEDKGLITKTRYRMDAWLIKELSPKISKIFKDLIKVASSWEDYEFIYERLIEHRDDLEDYASLHEKSLDGLVKRTLAEKDLTDVVWHQALYTHTTRSNKHRKTLETALLKRIKTFEECKSHMPGTFNACNGPTSLMKKVTLKACRIAKTEDEIVSVIGKMEFYSLCEKHTAEYIALLDKYANLVPESIQYAWGHWTWLYKKAREIGSKKHEELAFKKIKGLDQLYVETIRAKPMQISILQEWDGLRKYGGKLEQYAEKELVEFIKSISEDHEPDWEYASAWEFALKHFDEDHLMRGEAKQRLFAMT